MTEIFSTIVDWINATQVPDQLRDVDAKGLFTNPFFLLPFIGLVGHMIWRQAVRDLILMVLFIGLWMFTGSQMVQGIFVEGEIQIDKILPVLGVGVGAIAVIVYLFFIRSD
ncbi:MAG: hypothetical protein AB1634_09880 [Thermodesulfobacteriota bacterium]